MVVFRYIPSLILALTSFIFYSGEATQLSSYSETTAILNLDDIKARELLHSSKSKLQSFLDTYTKSHVGFSLKTVLLDPELTLEEILIELEFRLSDGYNVNDKDEYGDTLLHTLLKSGLDPETKLGITQVLLAFHIDVNVADSDGRNPLHLVSRYRNISEFERLEIASLLLLHGCKTYHKDRFGDTPPHLVLKSTIPTNEKIKLLYLYLIHGYNINLQDSQGQTLLHLLAWINIEELQQRMELMSNLMVSGAAFDIKDVNGRTPVDAVLASHFDEDMKAALFGLYAYNKELNYRKLLANSFALKGTTRILPEGPDISLEGLILMQSDNFLVDEASSFYFQLRDGLFDTENDLWNQILGELSNEDRSILNGLDSHKKDEVRQGLLDALTRTEESLVHSLDYLKNSAEVMAEEVNSGKLVAMKVTGSEHLFAVVTYRGNLYICNKGHRMIISPGVVKYAINRPHNIESIIQDFVLGASMDHVIGTDLQAQLGHHTIIQQRLGALKPVVILNQKAQRSGNCPIGSSNSMEYTLLYLTLNDVEGIPAKGLAKAIKTVHSKNRRRDLLQDYLQWHSSVNSTLKFPPDYTLLNMLLEKTTSYRTDDHYRWHLVMSWATKVFETETHEDKTVSTSG